MDDHEEEHLYPRPKLKRDSYISLNGEWAFCPNCDYEIEKYEIRETIEVTENK